MRIPFRWVKSFSQFMSTPMKKRLKQALSVLVVLVIMAISAYTSKKPTQDDSQKSSSVNTYQEPQEDVLASAAAPNAEPERKSSEKKSVKSSSGKAPVVAEKQTVPGPQSEALPVAQTQKENFAVQKVSAPVEVSAHRPAVSEAPMGWTTIPPPDFQPKGKWHRSNLERHWEKHQAEFPEFHNEQEYAVAALYFFEHPPKGTLTKTNRDGDRMFYHQDSNTFGVVTSDGTAKTMFRPSAGINYWRRQ